MKINRISFNGVYRNGEKNFTPVQYKISEYIKNTLTAEYNADKKGYTPNEKLKKQGYDTIIYPNGDDKVDVFVVTGIKTPTEDGEYSYDNSIFVGTYNNRSLFSSNNVYNVLGNKHSWKSVFLIPIVIFAIAITGNTIKKCSHLNSNNFTEQVLKNDSIKDSFKNVYNIELIKK